MSGSDFTDSLLDWYDKNKRSMPWRDSGNPYKVWISEIMLQQTRVDQATPYFNRFMERFPTIEDLAAASRQEVLKAWEGLGYYSRARNMHETAKNLVENYDGALPDSRKEILKLKGIGPYTASAILSIVYNKPEAVVDGNVIRVLTRYYGISDDIRSTQTKNEVQEQANELISRERPGDFNQALMELGSLVCTPSNPDCAECPVEEHCKARQTAQTDVIPYKSKTKPKPHHHIGVGIIEEDGKLLIALRPEDAMLGGLWEFPGGKQKKDEDIEETVTRELHEELGVEVKVIKPFMKLKHAYSHFSITLHAFLCELKSGVPEPKSSQEIRWVSRDELEKYPFPKANKKLTEKLIGDDQRELDL